jgi:cbb3-type cytochrome oxidase cytochrome c subunit
MECDFEYHQANKEAQYDGHGIFLTYTCDQCYTQRMKGFRADISTRYECDESIDEDW